MTIMYSERTQFIQKLFEAKGNEQYGEGVSQWEHAVQAATFARDKNAPREVIIAAFLHDIGHLIDDNEKMENLGNLYHEDLGAFYLKKLGFPEDIQLLVQNHVAAKRYLTATEPAYLENLSEASRKTLHHQGGPMDPAEVAAFEKDPRFEGYIQMRYLDDEAKVENYKVIHTDWIWDLMEEL